MKKALKISFLSGYGLNLIGIIVTSILWFWPNLYVERGNDKLYLSEEAVVLLNTFAILVVIFIAFDIIIAAYGISKLFKFGFPRLKARKVFKNLNTDEKKLVKKIVLNNGISMNPNDPLLNKLVNEEILIKIYDVVGVNDKCTAWLNEKYNFYFNRFNLKILNT